MSKKDGSRGKSRKVIDPADTGISRVAEKSLHKIRHPLPLVYQSGHVMPLTLRFAVVLSLAIALAPTLTAEMRPWKSADGTRSIQGELVKRDASTVTLRTDAGKEVTIELSKLHPDESKWLNLHHSLTPTAPPQDPTAFFDNLTFRDTRDTTLIKLKASKIVEMTTDETFIGRSGLNGIFKTRQKIAGLDAFLYFDWTESGKLKELTLQTDPRPESDYKTALEPSWKEMIELLGTLYGKPVQNGPLPPPNTLADGSFMPSHLWRLEGDGSALLGTARDGNNYQLVVRFRDKKAGGVEIP
ncbi:MAG: hypothetical protein ACRCXD_19400 [Luteolibacter sp.]